MLALLLIFLTAAWLSEGMLSVGLAPNAQVRRASLWLGLWTGAVLLSAAAMLRSAALPDAWNFLSAFGLLCVLLQLASGRAQPAQLQGAAQRWRMALPLISGNLALLAHVFIPVSPMPVTALWASVGLSIALVLLVPVAMAVLDRLQVSRVPAAMRGTPIVILTAALAAIGLAGLARSLPW